MALSKSILKQELSKLMDNTHPQFLGFSSNISIIGDRWANVVKVYSSTIVPPSATLETAKSGFYTTMLNMDLGIGRTIFQSAFLQFTLLLAAGMTPAFIGTPPPTPINFSSLYALPLDTDINTKIEVFATIIDAWFRTGTATPSGGGSPILWN